MRKATHRVLSGSSYHPGRGGHAPGDLRDVFGDAVETLRVDPLAGRHSIVELRDQQVTIAEVCGQLVNCTDILPSHLLNEIAEVHEMRATEELPRMRGSYAAAARLLLRVLA